MVNPEVMGLLNNFQPHGWPRWELGRDADGDLTAEAHLFMFVPTARTLLGIVGVPSAVCGWTDGAPLIGRGDGEEVGLDAEFCPHCLEVSFERMRSRDT